MALPSKLMYQNKRGITGFPCFREATACTSHLAPNMEAPVRPISFHGVMCTPVQSSQAIGVFMGSSMDASRVAVRDWRATRQAAPPWREAFKKKTVPQKGCHGLGTCAH